MTDVPPISDVLATHATMESVSTTGLKPSQSSYVNYCSVTATPEEVIIDFALEFEPSGGTQANPLKIPQRITLGLYTARRMLEALQLTIERFEANFGTLETEVDKRLVNRTK